MRFETRNLVRDWSMLRADGNLVFVSLLLEMYAAAAFASKGRLPSIFNSVAAILLGTGYCAPVGPMLKENRLHCSRPLFQIYVMMRSPSSMKSMRITSSCIDRLKITSGRPRWPSLHQSILPTNSCGRKLPWKLFSHPRRNLREPVHFCKVIDRASPKRCTTVHAAPIRADIRVLYHGKPGSKAFAW